MKGEDAKVQQNRLLDNIKERWIKAQEKKERGAGFKVVNDVAVTCERRFEEDNAAENKHASRLKAARKMAKSQSKEFKREQQLKKDQA